MSNKKTNKRWQHPVYKTVFSVTQELYENPCSEKPLLAHTVSGRLRIDLLRALCLGTLALSALAVATLLSEKR